MAGREERDLSGQPAAKGSLKSHTNAFVWEQVVTDTEPSNMVTFTHCPKKLWTVIGPAGAGLKPA